MPLVSFDDNEPHVWPDLAPVYHAIGCREQYHRIVPGAAVERPGRRMPVVAASSLEGVIVELRFELASPRPVDGFEQGLARPTLMLPYEAIERKKIERRMCPVAVNPLFAQILGQVRECTAVALPPGGNGFFVQSILAQRTKHIRPRCAGEMVEVEWGRSHWGYASSIWPKGTLSADTFAGSLYDR